MRNREAFEEWYSGTYRETIHILPNGQYASLRQQHSWDAWQSRVPEGYVVVPKEPTKAMQQSAFDVYEVCDYKTYHLNSGTEVRDMIYKSMIEAVEK